ncbi:MAG: hypothetical protein LBH91_06100 [Prevotellaceae bacterium]|jgi:hypothetical protein|nr:hypothetical protein [Prevotellaceae bacterium]
MRKNTIRLTALLIAFVALVTSCAKVDETNTEIFQNPYAHVGKLHNDFLTNVKNNFQSDLEITELEDGINFITDFNISYVSTLNISPEEKAMYVNSLNEYKRFVNTTIFYNEFFAPSTRSSEGKYFDYLEEALSLELIDDFEYEQLDLIGRTLIGNYNGNIPDHKLKRVILGINDQWIEQGYTVDSQNGQILAVTLAISISSIEWWEENPDVFELTRILPAWAGADIAGAVGGAIWSAITGGNLASGAAGGAIMGSTGVAGKVGKWLAKLF